MKYTILVFFSLLLLCLKCNLYAQDRSKPESFPLPIDREQIVSGELMFRMSEAGDSMGYSHITFEVGSKQVLVLEKARVSSSFSMDEDMISYLDIDKLEIDSVILTGAVNGKTFAGNTICSKRRIRASSTYTQLFSAQTTNIDTITKSPVVERLASLFLFPPAIDFSEFSFFKYPQFSTLDGRFREVMVTKTTDQIVVVPAGTFNTYKLELSGGAAQQIFYVSKDTPRKIVKIEFKDNNWVYELL